MSAMVQRSAEWHALRKNKIGASDASAIMEVSRWTTPYQLWSKKLGLIPEQETTPAMQRGIDLEDSAREMFEAMTGIFVLPMVVMHPRIDYLMASLDGMDIEKKNAVEIKTANKEDHAMAIAGQVPVPYIPQLQHQLEVCSLDMAYYFSYTGSEGVIVKVYRDEKYIKKMLSKEKEFWECLQDFIAPKMTARDFVQKTDPEWSQLATKWKSTKQQLTELESQEAELRKQLIGMCGTQNSQGGGVRASQVLRKGSCEYSRIPELEGVNLENYRKPSIKYWTIQEG